MKEAQSQSQSQSPVAPRMDNRFSTIAWSLIPLLGGMALNVAMNSTDMYISESLGFLKWGVYAGEYLALAVWLAWGPGAAFARVATVALFGFAWMVASWGAAWAFQVKIAPDFSWLQMFSVAPLVLPLGALPLIFMRSAFRFAEPAASPRQSFLAELAGGVAIFGLLIAVFGSWYLRRKQIESELMVVAFVPIVLGAIASAVAPVMARGFLGAMIQPHLVVLVPFISIMCAVVISLFLAVPGPGAAPIYPIVPAVLACVGISSCSIAAFGFWRSLGLRVVSETRKAEPGVGADSR